MHFATFIALSLSAASAVYHLSKIWRLISLQYFRPKFYYGSTPVSLVVKGASGTKDLCSESLRTFVETRCPSLLREFRPPWWLFTCHQQTGYSVFGDFGKVDLVEYDRQLLRTLDGGTIGLDFAPPEPHRTLSEDTPIVVVLHGLTGGSHEAYVRAVVAPACTPTEQGGLGYRAIVVNFRGCAGVPITSPQLYSAGHTDDIRVALYYIRKRYPKAPLLGVGFSLGACVLTRYVAEEGENCRLAAACVLACPWDMYANHIAIEGRWMNRKIYSSALGSNLQALVRLHADSFRKFPDSACAKVLDAFLAEKAPTLNTFDDMFNRHGGGGSAPTFPFDDVGDYYKWSSSHHVLPKVRIPFLAINAEDDPIVQVLPIEEGGNDHVAFAVTKFGGHLGWFEQGDGLFGVARWFSQPVCEWLRAVGEDLVKPDRPGKAIQEVNGFLKEVGRDDIGCMPIEGGGHIIGAEGQEGLLAGL